MLERDLRTSKSGSDVQAVARAFTLTVLRRVGPERKALVVRFLAQAGLIGSELQNRARFVSRITPPSKLPPIPPPPKVDLSGADLRNVALRSVELYAKSLRHADLRGADFRDALLVAVDFSWANLRGADFRGADMREFIAVGRQTNFFGACMTGVRFAGANLSGLDLSADGGNVDFSRADLTNTVLIGSDLVEPKYEGAKTKGTVFPLPPKPGWPTLPPSCR
jgi:uncharacterized protein YjbI with pentapeptide repeats